MKYFFPVLVIIVSVSCNTNKTDTVTASTDNASIETSRIEISAMLDSFNVAAGNADYQRYFNFYTSDAIFIGTDATEHWNKENFMIWAKPFFDRGKAWNFKSIERHIYFDSTGRLAWFDELLSTQMKICRGSGVVVKQGDDWKVKQYVLSMTIPNNLADSIVSLKSPVEDIILDSLTRKVFKSTF